MSDTSIAVLAASASLAGVIVAGGFGLVGLGLQRRHQLEDQQRAVEQVRRDEVRSRVDAKADDILHLLRAFEEILFSRRIIIGRYDVWPSDADEKREARRLWNEILVVSGYLTQPLRRHIRVLWIITDAERLAEQGWVDASARSIGFAAVRWARENLERYLRQSPGTVETPLRRFPPLADRWWLPSDEAGAAGSRAGRRPVAQRRTAPWTSTWRVS
jgi:hypothetical protein